MRLPSLTVYSHPSQHIVQNSSAVPPSPLFFLFPFNFTSLLPGSIPSLSPLLPASYFFQNSIFHNTSFAPLRLYILLPLLLILPLRRLPGRPLPSSSLTLEFTKPTLLPSLAPTPDTFLHLIRGEESLHSGRQAKGGKCIECKS